MIHAKQTPHHLEADNRMEANLRIRDLLKALKVTQMKKIPEAVAQTVAIQVLDRMNKVLLAAVVTVAAAAVAVVLAGTEAIIPL